MVDNSSLYFYFYLILLNRLVVTYLNKIVFLGLFMSSSVSLKDHVLHVTSMVFTRLCNILPHAQLPPLRYGFKSG